ncbi:hypothetical protein [Nocardia sp. NPDC050406]|uniref:hypothetical protein n=1 Tax=Nocardia sp. NPDC050406 TaxID=3364318 RepID=UPI0037B8DB8F
MSNRPDRHIVDAIDRLVDEQLADGEPCGGYDYGDPGFPMCPNPWCGEEWHGLPITARMAEMRWHGALDPGYRYHADDSVVLCPGSAFEGEFRAPVPRTRRTRRGPRPQWWCCFHAHDLAIEVEGEVPSPARVAVNGEDIELAPDGDGISAYVRYETAESGGAARARWIVLRAVRPPRTGVWVNWRPYHPE